MTVNWMFWVGFNIFVLVMLALDLLVFHRKPHEVKIREALGWSAVWIGLAMIFNLGIYMYAGHQAAVEFLAGYLIEKSLSVDNIFVFILIFSYFKVPKKYQHEVLFWGILGALIMRAIFIMGGIALMERFHFIIYIFGAFLIYTGIKIAKEKEKEIHPDQTLVLRIFKKFVPVTSGYEDGKFFVRHDGKLHATTLFVVLLVVESTDVIFAVDSIPAILAITKDGFIVYTSNVFAILGLRALYFALAGIMDLFRFLNYGLAAILIFVGTKMLIADFYHMPVVYSLLFIASALLLSVIASLAIPDKNKKSTPHAPSH